MNLEFTPEAEAEVDRLCGRYRMTRATLLQRSFYLLRAFLKSRENGEVWSVTSSDGTQIGVVQVPAIE